MTFLRFFLLLSVCVFLAACSTPKQKNVLTEAEAVQIASHEMVQHGLRLADFRPPEAMRIKKGKVFPAHDGFAIFFMPHVPVSGGDFMVIVDGKTRKVELRQGM